MLPCVGTVIFMVIKDQIKRKEYQANYMKNVWYPKNKEKHIEAVKALKKKLTLFIQDYKESRNCKDCGFSGSAYPQVLEFDHLRDKKFSIGEFVHSILSLETLKQEIAKCDLVCANCHRIRTVKRRLNSGVEK